MRFIFLLSITVLISLEVSSQNLLSNPSFEEKECKETNDTKTRYYERTLHWSDHDFAQFFSIDGDCPNVILLKDAHPRIPGPISGVRYGHYCAGFPAFRERLSHVNVKNQLKEPLKKDKKYFFRMYRMMAPWSEYTTNHWEVLLFPNFDEWIKARTDLRDHPNAIYTTVFEKNDQFLNTNPTNWEMIESCFTAQGGESILSFVYILPGDINSPHVKINPDYAPEIANGGIDLRNAFAMFVEDAQLEEVVDELSLTVEFCDNDRKRKLTKENFHIPDMATMAGTTYLWQDGNKELFRSMAGINFATLTVNMPCASFPVNVTVTEKACQEGVYLPQAFSPNKDGINDIFKPLGILFEVSRFIIYDRYGGELYKGSGPDAGWDGTSRGYDVQPGVYTWMLEYTTEYNETKVISGEVLLRR